MDLRQRLLATFRVEYAEHISRIRDLLTGFEAAGAASPGPGLDEMFRRAHSLKGASRAVDLRELEAIAHRMEGLLARVRSGEMPFRPRIAEVLHQAMDASDDLMAALSRSEPAPETTGILAAIDAVLAGDTAPAPEAAAGVKAEAQSPAPEPSTSAPVLPPGPDPVRMDLGDTRAERAVVEPAVSSHGVETAAETVRIPVQVLDRLLRVAGLLHVGVLHQEQFRQHVDELEMRLQLLEGEFKGLRTAVGRAKVDGRELPVERVQEALTSFARRQREVAHGFCQADWHLRQLDEQLQEEVRIARLVPAESILGGFRQMVREIARDVGKEITFRVSGFDVQADRSVLQDLKDPIMHLLRNAIDHGVEDASERARQGKPRAGQLTLSLAAGHGLLRVTVQDDGRGIDLAQVRSAAVRSGRISAAEAELLAPEEMGRLIFEPGLSTARFVTDLSGRGMGLSVVSEAVTRLGGNIEALPGQPYGAQLRITVPIAVSTLSLLVVRVAGQAFGLPSQSLSRLLHVSLDQIGSLEGQPTVTVDEAQIPLTSLAHLLGLRGAELHATGKVLPVAVLSVGGMRVGLVVDGFETHTEAVLHDLGAPFAALEHVSGGFLGEEGEIVLALNASALAERFRKREGTSQLRIMQPEIVEPEQILVVDDSITTRTLEKSVLEAHGYHVRVAVDGMEALALLHQELPDLVIADIEMPRLDGFGLLEAIRKDPALQSLPVIMVTSLDKREHRQRGLDLGADAYIVKQHFDQSALLETIRRLL